METGVLQVGDEVEATVDLEKRRLTMKNHTATHLLQAALQKTLGQHVKQAGSLVSPERLRFDFTHYAPLTKAEIQKIEDLVNEQIWMNCRRSNVGHGSGQRHEIRRHGSLWRKISGKSQGR